MGTDYLPHCLSAEYKESFAYLTINSRLPVILARIADSLCRRKDEIIAEYGRGASEDIKSVIGLVSRLRYQVQTDKGVPSLEAGGEDQAVWNQELAVQTEAQGGQPPCWYSATWLYLECYMYRALNDYVSLTSCMKSFDLFREQKRAAYLDAEAPVASLMAYLDQVTSSLRTGSETNVYQILSEFIQVALWGNKCDLSISAGAENPQKDCLLQQLELLAPRILRDDTAPALAALAAGGRRRVDIILDNAGFELATDLALAEVLLATGRATCVTLHGKAMPWFVSDVTLLDLSWTLDTMAASKHVPVAKMAALWKSRLADGTFVYKAHPFWTMPYDFALLRKHAPDLYADLAQADFLVFKGDLNYRKLVGDRAWTPTHPFHAALRGFHPAPLLSLRALKADTVTGLRPGLAEEVAAKDSKWMVEGNWAMISFCGQRDT